MSQGKRILISVLVGLTVTLILTSVMASSTTILKEVTTSEYPISKIISQEKCVEQYNMAKSSLIKQYGTPVRDTTTYAKLYDGIDYQMKQTTWEYRDTTINLSVIFNTFAYNNSTWIDYSAITVKKRFSITLLDDWLE